MTLPRGFRVRRPRTEWTGTVTGHDQEQDEAGNLLYVVTCENGGDMVEFLSHWPAIQQQFRVGDTLRLDVGRMGEGGESRSGNFTQPGQRARDPRRRRRDAEWAESE